MIFLGINNLAITKDMEYPEDFINKVINGDCLEVMKEMPDKSVDCIITDPPFFMPAAHYASRVHWQRNYGDLTPLKVFWNEIVKDFRRILKDDGHLFVFSNCDSYPVFYEPTYNHFDKLKSIVWNKGKVGLGRIFRNQHELIIWARNEHCRENNDHKLRADVLTYKATPSASRTHPVEKPTEMLKELMIPATFERDIVFDPFVGSGTTLEAAKDLNRNFIGIEISPEYCKIAEKRLAQEMLF